MFIGGYALLDGTGIDLTDATKQTVTGIYSKAAQAYKSGKMVQLINTVNTAGVVSPIPVMVQVVSTAYVLSAGPYVITIGSDDGATVVDNTPELGNSKKSSK